jgi:hypothetical protein
MSLMSAATECYDVSCMKHAAFAQYQTARKECHRLMMAAKTLPFIMNLLTSYLWESIDQAYDNWHGLACTCIDADTLAAPGTYRMGGSWASGLGDVANLEDLAEYED